ncbi:retropepsin-like aspartic protease (plasmid) [Methylomarinum sp. Ch1-1]|uniref:Retropepsin-like aspartic protease n=1 Tax=Methylomarinum roseum TaxID=3067653 RepID=A0AAU7NP65_9GAMM|nr:retropepsin-like aspartic protease [Methylomarinum sp. Ch1-1]MDP4523074.1 retropepsin-like aspartic protease [Methylomarinum sp. Ch1-1]
MGIQDRDYYWEKYKKTLEEDDFNFTDLRRTNRAHTPYRRKPQNHRSRYLIPTILSLAAIWYGSGLLMEQIKIRQAIKQNPQVVYIPEQRPAPAPTSAQPIPAISGGIRIKADKQGHFRGTVLINNVPMPFLIDTGATKTVIPEKFAASARLPYGQYAQANTAGGSVSVRKTTINTLKIGNALIRNLDAKINGHLDEVLIGMNTLRYFRMTQNQNILTLVANGKPVTQVHTEPSMSSSSTVASSQPVRKPTTIKKTVACDQRNVCKTTYSDH